MNAPRIIGLLVAVLAGGVAFFMAMSGGSDKPVEIVQRIEEKTVRVLVADAALQRGDRLSTENIRWVDWPEKVMSDSYIREGQIDEEEMQGAIARTGIVEGEPIIEAKIVRAGSSGMMSAVLAPGMRAITTRVTPETASGGFVLPGDRVDIYYTEPNQDTDETEFSVLLENVKVLAIDAMYSENAETPHIAGATATLELSPDDATYFTTARNSRGQISLALRSVFEPETPVKSRPRTDVDVIRYGRS